MYKFFNGGVLIIDYQNVDIETLLTDLNNGMTPGQAVDDYRPFVQVEEELINNFVPPACIGEPGVGQSKFVEIRPLLGLRMTFRMRIHGGEAQLRSKTRAYRWTGSNWTRRRINMSAGFLHGTTVSLPSQECNELETVPDNWKKSKRRRRSRTFREYWDLPQPFPFQLQENLHTLETWHRLGNDIHTESAPFQY